MRENTDQKSSEYRHFLRSVQLLSLNCCYLYFDTGLFFIIIMIEVINDNGLVFVVLDKHFKIYVLISFE